VTELCQAPITRPKSPRLGQPCGEQMPCRYHAAGVGEIPATAIAEILEVEILARAQRDVDGQTVHGSAGGSGVSRLAAEMAASGQWTQDGAARLIWSIRNGDRHKVSTQVVDRILIALDLSQLWHSHPVLVAAAEAELAAAEQLPKEDICSECGDLIDRTRTDSAVGAVCSICWARTHHGFPWGNFRRAELLELYTRYVREGLTIAELADPLWQAKGYAKRAGAISALQQAWRRNGWPLRTRSQTKSLARKRLGARLLSTRSLSEAEARRLHPEHWDEWKSINQLARENHERLGLTQSALCSQLSYTWKLLDLPRHDRIEMTVRASTKHGMKRRKGNSAAYKRFRAGQLGKQYDAPCQAETTTGKPCRARAMLGKTHCQTHDPELRRTIVAQIDAMRARSPISDPARVEPLPPLQADLRAYFEYAGTWKHLSDELGRGREWLSRLSNTKQQKNVARDVARDLRAAIARLTAPSLQEAA